MRGAFTFPVMDGEQFFEEYAGPAAFLLLKGKKVRLKKVNTPYLKETREILNKEALLMRDFFSRMDDENQALYREALKKARESSEEITVDTERLFFSQCCGLEHCIIRSRIRFMEEVPGGALFYVRVENITEDRQRLKNVQESELRFRSAAEQANVYAWEYDIRTREMRPCVRCMRDLGLPALLENYPEPAIAMGIFPPEVADRYRSWHERLAKGEKTIEGILPLTLDRIPFHVRYTTEFDTEGNPVRAFGSATQVVETEKENEYFNIILALSRSYVGVFKINVQEGTAVAVKLKGYKGFMPEGLDMYANGQKPFPYLQLFERYVLSRVAAADRDRLLKAVQPDYVLNELRTKDVSTGVYRIVTENETHYYRFSFLRLPDTPDLICVFQNIDDEVTEERRTSELLEKALQEAKRADETKAMLLSAYRLASLKPEEKKPRPRAARSLH